jgi:hypothetical protein
MMKRGVWIGVSPNLTAVLISGSALSITHLAEERCHASNAGCHPDHRVLHPRAGSIRLGNQGVHGAMGTSMALGGLARMLAGSLQAGGPETAESNNESFFSGPENTIQQGACIPAGCGEMLIGSVVTSAGTTAEVYPCGSSDGLLGANGGTDGERMVERW